MFDNIKNFTRGVIHRMIPYKDIESVENIETPLSTDMINALDTWYNMYLNHAPWLSDENGDEEVVKSLNLPAFISSEIARQIIIELNWDITGKSSSEENSEKKTNPRAVFLKENFSKIFNGLIQKLEQGCAAGGMTVRPYPNENGGINFAWTCDWTLYPVAISNDGKLLDVIFRDSYTEGKDYYTRLERHQVEGDNVRITQRAFKSTSRDSIGKEISLSSVPQWANLKDNIIVENAEGQMFGWFKVAMANNIDPESPMGASVFSKAVDVIEEADKQYSRLLWEYEGSELAIDVDPSVLRPKKTANGLEMPKLNKRLFRAVDADKGERDLYETFSPAIRDANLVNGLNQLLMRIEDLCGLSRGTIADANAAEARTATEMRILKQRSYTTIFNNQTNLEVCFRDVIRAMDKFATLYNLAPEGEYDVSFDWDDSILVDKAQEMNEDLSLVASGLMSKTEFRQRHFGETKAQAQAALEEIRIEQVESMQALMPQLDLDNLNNAPQNDDTNDDGMGNGIKGVSPANGTQPTPPTKPTS